MCMYHPHPNRRLHDARVPVPIWIERVLVCATAKLFTRTSALKRAARSGNTPSQIRSSPSLEEAESTLIPHTLNHTRSRGLQVEGHQDQGGRSCPGARENEKGEGKKKRAGGGASCLPYLAPVLPSCLWKNRSSRY